MSYISSKKVKISLILVGIGVILYFLPFVYTVQIANEHNSPVNGTITVYWHNFRVSSSYGNSKRFILPSSSYVIEVDSYGYSRQRYTFKNRLFDYTAYKKEAVIMHPRRISLAELEYLDPTGTVALYPKFIVNGTTIQGDNVMEEYGEAPTIEFGFYSIEMAAEHFELRSRFEGDHFTDNSSKIYLAPDEEALIISEKEMDYIKNFFDDFIDLSMSSKIDLFFRGYPKQYYLYSQKRVLSLGDMILLFCEEQAYAETKRAPMYFVLPQEYGLKEEGPCYASMLKGKIPDGVFKDIPFKLIELNQRKKSAAVAFSYDIESGRYVSEGGIGPCENDTYKLGTDQADCSDPNYIAWFTPLIDDVRNTQYPYPWVSGISGFKQILSISSRYGIPATYFMVARDVIVFDQLEPELIENTRYLAGEGLVEIGCHTFYHTRLGAHSVEFDSEQIKLSKEYLEKTFDTEVIGFRGPYFSLVGDSEEINANVLYGLGFGYSSNENSDYRNPNLINKPVNGYIFSHADRLLVNKLPYWYSSIITIDHPWNIGYTEIDEEGNTYLAENPAYPDYYRAKILSAISEGYIPYLVRDIPVLE